jgi:hypothetical protein
LALSNDQIIEYLEQLDRQSKAFKEEVLKYCWYMRGGLTYDEAMLLSVDERKMISDLISANLETTKKSGLPFF